MTPLQVKDCPPDVYQALRECATRENRSISQQTVTILQEYLGMRSSRACAHARAACNGSPYSDAPAVRARAPKQELSHVDALRRIANLAPVALAERCPTPAQMVRQMREEEAR